MASGTAKKSAFDGRPMLAPSPVKADGIDHPPPARLRQRTPLAALSRTQIRQMSESLGRLADEGRLRILLLLEEGPRNVAALGAALGQDRHSLSHHLRILRVSELIQATRDGRRVDYALTSRGRLGVRAARILIA